MICSGVNLFRVIDLPPSENFLSDPNIIFGSLFGGQVKFLKMKGGYSLPISLIIYSELSRVMKDKNLYKTYTLSEVFYELKKLRSVTLMVYQLL